MFSMRCVLAPECGVPRKAGGILPKIVPGESVRVNRRKGIAEVTFGTGARRLLETAFSDPTSCYQNADDFLASMSAESKRQPAAFHRKANAKAAKNQRFTGAMATLAG
jgi:hypothetical protein